MSGSKGPIITKEVSIKEIQSLIESFAQAALRVKLAGCDAVEIHCHAGYGLAAFISPLTNARMDMYGRDLEGRMRFPLEVIRRVKSLTGDDFPVICRTTAREFSPRGLTPEEAAEVARMFQDAGVHAIDLSCGAIGELDKGIPPSYYPRGSMQEYATLVKREIGIPLIMVGALNDPKLAEMMLEQGAADFVALGRSLIADPDLPRKLAGHRSEDILKCTRCNDGCVRGALDYTTLSCAINPEAGRESQMRIQVTKQAKKVLIIGGGPGGMEAARVAALRRHEVILWEQRDILGGNLQIASTMDFKEEYSWLIAWFQRQLAQLGVEVRINKVATVQAVEESKADAVVVATGSTPVSPDIPGVDNAVQAVNVLQGKSDVGEKVVIIGGGLVGCDLALHLALQGRKVTVVEMADEIAADQEPVSARVALLARLKEEGVDVLIGTKAYEIGQKSVSTIDKTLNLKTLEADSIILAVGFNPNGVLARDLVGKVPEIFTVGDCVKPRRVLNAIYEGSLFARTI
jgi:NADPH-dependent 2,4-dienoyl-CoA reductase/sulfur reductase-like enzyme